MEKKQKNKTTNPDSMNDAKTFGPTLRGISSKRRATGNIHKDVWLDHFSTVFNITTESQQHDNISVGLVDDCLSDEFNFQLNRDISYAEVSKATNLLKQNKAVGPDTSIPEVFIHSEETIIAFLVELFIKVFASGQFSDAWAEAIIQPLHKKGNVPDPYNHRGIS